MNDSGLNLAPILPELFLVCAGMVLLLLGVFPNPILRSLEQPLAAIRNAPPAGNVVEANPASPVASAAATNGRASLPASRD